MTTTAIPNRAVFRSQEVCEIVQVQPYVLRSWEAEFPDLGMSKSAGAPRVYRRADVARVLRLKQLLFEEGLTLAGARRQLAEEGPGDPATVDEDGVPDADVAELLDQEVRDNLRTVRSGLQWILGVLNGKSVGRPEEFRLVAASVRRGSARKPAKAGKTTKSSAAKTIRKAIRLTRPSKAVRHTRPAKKAVRRRR